MLPIAFVLVVMSTSGNVPMVALQEFGDENSCKHAMVTIGYDEDAKSFRSGYTTKCIPKAGYGQKQEPAQK